MTTKEQISNEIIPRLKSDNKYRSKILATLFSDSASAIELCNAVTGTNYPENAPAKNLTLNNSLGWFHNDLASIIANQILFMIEHQSRISANMPLRYLPYITDTLYRYLIEVKKLYGSALQKIPTPKFYVLYNGTQPLKATTLRLSDAFLLKEANLSIELVVEVIDINYNENNPVLKKSKKLMGYAYLIEQIRQQINQDFSRDAAISYAIDLCIKEGILVKFLKENYEEVAKMFSFEYNYEDEMSVLQEEAWEGGKVEGIEQGMEKGKTEGIFSVAKKMLAMGIELTTIAKSTELTIDTLQDLKQQMALS